MTDPFRIERNRKAIESRGWDGLICGLPSNVLLLSGYFPVTGTSIAVATPKRTLLLVPEDEKDLAGEGWADEVRTFQAGSLDWIKSTRDAVLPALRELLDDAGITRGAVGYEAADWFQPASYAAMHVFGRAMHELLREAAPSIALAPAEDCLETLRLTKTPSEVSQIRVACHTAGRAFAEAAGHVAAGKTETDVAAAMRAPLIASPDGRRADGFAFCMSGPNAAEASRAYQRNRSRELSRGDLVLAHCNSHVGGFWTDITRTYCLGGPTNAQRRRYDAVFEAQDAALNAIRPGARAHDIDHAARQVIARHGFGDHFITQLGHGVGFSAINHNARPRLHPKSTDTLDPGMVFNVEPGLYFPGECGLRQCNMVHVTEKGAELLTPFQNRPEDLIL